MSKTTDCFDPEDCQKYPFIILVEEYLGGVGKSFFSNGTVQLIKRNGEAEMPCSPRLPQVKLEQFCKDYINIYKTYYYTHESLLEEGLEIPPIKPFWDSAVMI